MGVGRLEHRVSKYEVDYQRLVFNRQALKSLKPLIGRRFTLFLDELALPNRMISRLGRMGIGIKMAKRLQAGRTYRLEIKDRNALRLFKTDQLN